jgi:hypothetical protein
MSAKLVAVWVLGALLLFGGVWIVNNLEMTVGVPMASYAMGMVVSIVLFLLAGLCWISVAVGTRKKFL